MGWMDSLFGSLGGPQTQTDQPDPYGGYYNKKAAMLYALGNMGQGLGYGLMTRDWKNALNVSNQDADGYQRQVLQKAASARLLQEADYKKQERAQAEAAKKQRDDYIASLPPAVRVKALSIPGYLEKWVAANDPSLQGPQNPGENIKVIGGYGYDTSSGQWLTPPDAGNGWQTNLPKGYRMKADGSGAEPIPGVITPGSPKPYTPGSTDRTAVRNAREENAILTQTLTNLDEASGLVANSNSGFLSVPRARLAENLPDWAMPDAVVGSPKQGANTLRLKQIMDAEALASMSKLLKGPTSDKDVAIMLQTVNDPNASPKRKQESIDQVKRVIRAQIAANEDNINFSLNGPNGQAGGAITTPDGITIEEVPSDQ